MSNPYELEVATRNQNDKYILWFCLRNNGYGLPANMDGQLVMDIGAHIGAFALACAVSGATVMAFEPQLENYNLLKNNTRELEVACYNKGIGAPGTRKLYGRFSFGSLFIEEEPFSFVDIISLKEALGDNVFDLIKINAEGAEYEIIPEIEKYHEQIKKVIIEFHNGRVDPKGYSMTKKLNNSVYEFTLEDYINWQPKF